MKKLFRWLRPYRLTALLAPLLMIGEVSCDLALPYLMSFIINYGISGISLTDPEHGSAAAVRILSLLGAEGCSRVQMIVTFGLLMLLVTLVGGAFGVGSACCAAYASQHFGHDLRCEAYRRVMALSIEQTDRFTIGSLVTRMTNDVSMTVDFMEMFLHVFVRAPMFLIGGVAMLLALDLSFGFVLMVSLPVLLLVLTAVLSKAVPLFGVVQKKLDRVNSVVQENVSGARVVKAYVREDYECSRFSAANGELCSVNCRVLNLMAVISPVLTLLLNGSIIAVLYIGGWSIQNGVAGMTTGAVMAAVTYVTQSIQAVMMVAGLFQSISRADASAKRICEVMEVSPAIVSGGRDAAPTDPAVEFDHVSFRYPGTKGDPVLRDICLSVKRGEVLAVIGATGCGKSSLLSLVPRFYDAAEGTVRVDGLPVKDFKLSALREKIGYVMQKSELFSDTLANNIRWGKKDASGSELEAAASTAQAEHFIQGFAEGFDTPVAEMGSSLSGGQKQRISIARALVRRPEILILDDSTSALDLATEGELRAALRQQFRGTTVILVAQRIASVRDADRIAVLESDGRIIHCAPHEQLLAESETYRSIVESQRQTARGAARFAFSAGVTTDA